MTGGIGRMATRTELAWAAGIFEGEGFSGEWSKGWGRKRELQLVLVNTNRSYVERFAKAIGTRNAVQVRYRHGCRPIFTIVVHGSVADAAIRKLSPYLTPSRVIQ